MTFTASIIRILTLIRDAPARVAPSLLVRFAHSCGWGEIRTHGPLARTTVFKTVALNHSATHPFNQLPRINAIFWQ